MFVECTRQAKNEILLTTCNAYTAYCVVDISNNSDPSHHNDVTPPMTTLMTSEAEPLTLAERLLLLSKEQRLLAEEILLVIRYVTFAISLPTTICSIVVFLQREMHGATSVYVVGLSVSQLVYIITNIVGRVMYAVVENPFNSYAYIFYRSVSV